MSSHHLSHASATEILRYRSHRGLNLPGVFFLDRTIFPSMFDAGATGRSELDAVVSSIVTRGIDATREIWEAHWASALSDENLMWLANVAHINMIRLPIGYFTLGPEFCAHTPFAMQPAEVYANAWNAVKNLTARCYRHGIGVLINFQALPGGANCEVHSGTSSRKAELWENQFNLDLATRCILFVAGELKRCDELRGVIGIQICNEAQKGAETLYGWYDEVIDKIAPIHNSIPIYVSHASDLERTLRWASSKDCVMHPAMNQIVVDTRQPQTAIMPELEITAQADPKDCDRDVFDNGFADSVFLGELDSTDLPEQENLMYKSVIGFAFSIPKMDRSSSSLQTQLTHLARTAPAFLSLPTSEVESRSISAEHERSKLMLRAVKAHYEYWENRSPGKRFEQWRFARGWHGAWTDGRDFFRARADGIIQYEDNASATESEKSSTLDTAMQSKPIIKNGGVSIRRNLGGEKIGFVDLWVLKRMRDEKIADKNAEEQQFGWEWEQGFRRGLADFYHSVGI